MLYAAPGTPGAKIQFKAHYDNFIGGQFVPPVKGQYFDVITPVSGTVYTKALAPPPKTSKRRSTLRMPRPTRGARRHGLSAHTSC